MHLYTRVIYYFSIYVVGVMKNGQNVQRYSEAVWVVFSEQNGDGATIAAEVEQFGPEVGGSTSQ